MRRNIGVPLLLGLFLASTARAEDPEPLRGDTLFASQMCNTEGSQAAATLINDQQTLESIYARFQSNTLGASHPVPKMNFARDTLLLIEMGQRPTGGYQVAYNYRQPVALKKDHLAVTVNWVEPDANTLTVQMLTSPCVLLRLPKGDYPKVRVFDQDGRQRIPGG